ncbi:carbohydrate ABC transporter permease [Alkalihalobacillus oceani]|uniref:Carbohydrate ABC transporter permease n=1 Tax=Halalkalibacter oceani TaxID=1653776 RepID=A0A9X2DSN3_9BACI|nr:carbohydrate ABC transporter permease [Halalkalibacter oceani]MCM3714538.1 carbohydrate ABC transporter permease [Halalkalibacter oceani]
MNRGIAFRLINGIFLTVLVLTMLLPVLNTLAISLSTSLASMSPGVKLWPREFSLEGYTTVWSRIELWRPFLNNSIVTIFGTFFHVFLAAIAGYVLIQHDLPGRKLMTTFIIVTMIIPAEAIMIPLYIVNRDLGLLNTLASLVISGLVSGFSILLMRNYFLSVPKSLAEAANIDGAGHIRILFLIYLPLSLPGLATVTLFEFVSRWNQFLPALLYITDSSKYTLQVALRSLILQADSSSSSYFLTPNIRMAGIMIALIPLLIIYPFIQKYFVKGIMSGSTKE